MIDELRAEHDLIEAVAGSLRAFVAARARGEGDPEDGSRFIRFFKRYAGDFHHAREEDTLFVALASEAELPADRGPIAVMLDDHRRMAGILDALEPILAAEDADAAATGRARELAFTYTESLWHHIDAENSVLLPESEHRLRRHGIDELPSRAMTSEERDARELGQQLIERYPPSSDRDVMRGEGCVMCPAFVDSCRGLEHEWWNEWEWDELEDHLPNG